MATRRIAITLLPDEPGHLRPLSNLARRLRDHGHEVALAVALLLLAGATACGDAEATGRGSTQSASTARATAGAETDAQDGRRRPRADRAAAADVSAPPTVELVPISDVTPWSFANTDEDPVTLHELRFERLARDGAYRPIVGGATCIVGSTRLPAPIAAGEVTFSIFIDGLPSFSRLPTGRYRTVAIVERGAGADAPRFEVVRAFEVRPRIALDSPAGRDTLARVLSAERASCRRSYRSAVALAMALSEDDLLALWRAPWLRLAERVRIADELLRSGDALPDAIREELAARDDGRALAVGVALLVAGRATAEEGNRVVELVSRSTALPPPDDMRSVWTELSTFAIGGDPAAGKADLWTVRTQLHAAVLARLAGERDLGARLSLVGMMDNYAFEYEPAAPQVLPALDALRRARLDREQAAMVARVRRAVRTGTSLPEPRHPPEDSATCSPFADEVGAVEVVLEDLQIAPLVDDQPTSGAPRPR